jgi:NAD(P)-dependent dehydrogenase (short-subunit alcohol dehydrogenase family)
MKIENAVALVTGSNRGLGLALVNALLSEGAKKVYATGRDVDALKAARFIDEARVARLTLDVMSEESAVAAAKSAGDVNLLINNAGVLHAGSLLSAPFGDVERDLVANVLGTLKVTRAFLPVLEGRRGDSRNVIVNVLSMAALAGVPFLGGYVASKAAAHSVTQSLRAELKARGIDVLGAYAGGIDTDMVRAFPFPKTAPSEVAGNIVRGIRASEPYITTDEDSRSVVQLFLSDPRALERRFAEGPGGSA